MAELVARKSGRVGRITLTRAKSLNALSHDMCLEMEDALDDWRDDDNVHMLVIDAEGEKAFCAGGDIVEMYEAGKAGDLSYGRSFWRDEYRMNAKLFEFPKPVASFMQGFTMGGGVGVGCHGSHRVVGETSLIAMPECGIGLIPDVGGSLILSRAPGRVGEYLGLTASRMNAADAIFAGFADYFIPESNWPALIAQLESSGNWDDIEKAASPAPDSGLAPIAEEIDAHFAGERMGDIVRSLENSDTDFATEAAKKLSRNSPLAMACALEVIHRVRGSDTIRRALDQEYRYTHRSVEHGDFVEGIRAQIIDKDRNPTWRHTDAASVSPLDVTNMLMPVTDYTLQFEGKRP